MRPFGLGKRWQLRWRSPLGVIVMGIGLLMGVAGIWLVLVALLLAGPLFLR